MPLLTSMATLAGLGLVPMGDFESIATVTVGSGGAANADFQSIPSTYQHLQLRIIVRTARSAVNLDGLYLRMNNDSGNNYASHYLQSNPPGASAGATTSGSAGEVYRAPGTNATASAFGGIIIDILDYADTSKNKTVRYLGGVDLNGAGEIYMGSNLWMDTSAIDRLTISSSNSFDLLEHTTAALYGVKA